MQKLGNKTKNNTSNKTLSKNSTKQALSKYSPSFFAEDDEDTPSGSLGYYTKQLSLNRVTVPLDEEIKAPVYYRHVVQGVADLSENDTVVFRLNTPGGNADGMISILTAIAATNAVTVAEIYGQCHSAGSFIALSCDKVHVSPYATMMIHFVSHGSAGKSIDVVRHVTHTHARFEQLFRTTYDGFLTEEEIEQCLNGAEIWLDSEQILDRLIAREEYRKVLEEQEDEGSEVDQGTEDNLPPLDGLVDMTQYQTKQEVIGSQTKSEGWQADLDNIDHADIF